MKRYTVYLAVLAIFVSLFIGVSVFFKDSTYAAVNYLSGKTYTASVPASPQYPDTNYELTDKVYATPMLADDNWQGRDSVGSYYFIVDLGTEQTFGYFKATFYKYTGAAIHTPTQVQFSYSTNNSTWTTACTVSQQGSGVDIAVVPYSCSSSDDITARYVKMTVTSVPDTWSFIDEWEVSPKPPTLLKGSFIQPYLTDSWTAANFDAELQYMIDAKIDEHIIWQWTADSKTKKIWYPTALPGWTRANTYDAVEVSLASAQAKGMKVWLGLNWNNDWFGKYANDNVWLTNEFNISKSIAKELWDLYGATYGDTIAGFYITMEVDNVNFSSSASKTNIINAYQSTVDYIHSHADNKPVMVAPFFNSSTGMSAKAYADFWGDILASAAIDVVAMQDGVGAGNTTVSTIGPYYAALRDKIASVRPSTQLWSDLETFDTNFNPAPISRVIEQINAVKNYVSKFTSFSFNHYDSPQQGHTTQYNDYKAYADSQP